MIDSAVSSARQVGLRLAIEGGVGGMGSAVGSDGTSEREKGRSEIQTIKRLSYTCIVKMWNGPLYEKLTDGIGFSNENQFLNFNLIGVNTCAHGGIFWR